MAVGTTAATSAVGGGGARKRRGGIRGGTLRVQCLPWQSRFYGDFLSCIGHADPNNRRLQFFVQMISSFLRSRALPFLFLVLCLPLAALKAQPVVTLASSGYSVELGGNVTLDGVTVNGQSPFTYQWVEQGANNSIVVLHDGATANGSTLSGTTTRGLLVAGATVGDAGAYAIEVTDANGASTTSAWITLTVKAPAAPTITAQPANVTLVAGNNATFSVSATGSYPRTYQWYKGAVGSGSAIAGATNNPFTITGALAGDAGSYYATISNAYGSATSTAATLTVNAATPITYSGSGSAQTAYVGQSLTLSMYPSGSSPITYQWQKNGSNITGATNYSYTINPVALSDAGTYTQVATNAAGTVTSPAITLTVNPAVAVTFPAATPVTITAGQSLNLYMAANGGSAPITYQWQKDGVAITGATSSSYYRNPTTTADSGNYTVVGTNPAGSTTSPIIQVTVNPPLPPTITTAPASQSIAQGNYVTFNVGVGGSYPFTYQWLKNGTPISAATYNSYSISAVQPGDAASYSVTVSNAAGSVTSPAATLTVLPPVAPSYTGTVQQLSVNQGSNLTLSAPSPSGGAVGPYTYQWFKDGTAIAGATGATYTVSNVPFTAAGTYAVTVTNAGGAATPPPTEVTITAPAATGTAWIDAVQQGSIIYFLFAGHIERYDAAAGSWLPSTTLSQTATAFCVAADGVYVGFGRALAKFPLDLSSQTTLANLGGSILSMFSLGNYIYAATASSPFDAFYPIDRNSGAVGTASSMYINGAAAYAVIPASGTIYTPNSIWGPQFLTADGTGKLNDAVSTTYYGTFPGGTRAYVLPDQQHVADNGGTVFNVSDGKVAATFGGKFTDMTFLADGTPVVLRNNILYTYAVGGMKETAHTALPVAGTQVFASGGNVLVFYPGTSTGNSYVGLTPVAAATISSGYAPAPAVDASALSFAPATTFHDNAGVVYLYDAARENLYRWSPAAHAYLAPLPLAGAPTQFLYSSTLNAIYCVYRSGRITRIDLSASSPAEQPFSTFPDVVITAVGADNFLFAILQDAQSSGQDETLIDGRTGAITAFDDRGTYYAASYTWSSANQTLYPNPTQYGTSGSIQSVSSTGTLPAPTQHFSQAATGAVFASADGSRLVAAGGQVFDANLMYLGVLGNTATEVAFLGNTPYTMRPSASGGTEIQAWSPTNFVLAAAATLPGTPVRLVSLAPNQFLVVTQAGGVPTFTILNGALQRVSTTATGGSSSGAPTFVSQPAASLTVFSGTPVTLAVDTAGATPQTFQWYKNGAAIAGATTSALALPSAGGGDAANYYVVASNGAGSATSTTTTLSVYPRLAFTTQPQNQVANYNGSATFTAAVANDTGASYQWFYNQTAVSGATSNTLVVSPVNSQNYGTYILKVGNTAGAIYSNAVTLLPPPPAISTQPQSVTVVAGGSTSLYVSATNATSFQWYFNGGAIPNATSSSYWLSNVTAANAGSYTVVVTGQGGSTTSAAALVTVQNAPPPAIATGPQSTTAAPGSTVTLTVSGSNATAYQWYRNGVAVSGATSASLVLSNLSAANAGTYTVVLTGPGGTLTSSAATVTVQISPYAGTYFGTINGGGNWAMWVPAAGNAKFIAYLPSNNGAVVGDLNIASGGTFSATSLSGYSKTGSLVTLPSAVTGQISNGGVTGNINNAGGNFTGTLDTGTAMPALAGYYPSLALNGAYGQSYAVVGGSGQAFAVWVNFQGVGTQPDAASGTLTGDPQFSGTSALGHTVTLALDATSGVLTETLTGSDNTAVTFGGVAATVTNTARLLNLSSRADVGSGGNVLISGFSLAGTGGKGILIRAVGPGLTNYGLTNPLPAPKVTFNDGNGTALWSGTSWGGGTSLINAFNAVGAFPLDPASADAAHTFVTTQGRYTATVASADTGTGIALAEVYDTDGAANGVRLVNLSARANVESGAGVLTAGLVVGGNGPETVLLRGIGPALNNYGITNYLAAPQLTLYDGASHQLAVNTGWTDASGVTSSTMNKVSAFALAPGSADCVIIATLMPGRYTVQVSSRDTNTGVALVEVYEVPQN